MNQLRAEIARPLKTAKATRCFSRFVIDRQLPIEVILAHGQHFVAVGAFEEPSTILPVIGNAPKLTKFCVNQHTHVLNLLLGFNYIIPLS